MALMIWTWKCLVVLISNTNVRKRARHSEQDLLRESGKKYMEKMGEQPLCGMWTAEEHYVFLAIVEHIQDTLRNVNTELVCEIYLIARRKPL